MLKMERTKLEAKKKEEEAAVAATERAKSNTKRLGEGNLPLDKDKLAQAMKDERKRKAADMEDGFGDKRRKFNTNSSSMDVDVTEEDLGTCLYIAIVLSRR